MPFLMKKQLTLVSVYDLLRNTSIAAYSNVLCMNLSGDGRLGTFVHLLCFLSLLPVPGLHLHRAPQERGPAGESQTNC